MQSTTLNDIRLAVFKRVDAATGLLPIKHHKRKFEHNDNPFAEVIISPIETRLDTADGGDLLGGFILVNVYVPKNYGAFYPAEEGQKFLDLFPRDLTLGSVRITKSGTIQTPVDDGAWDFTPVLIQYEAASWQV